MNPYNTFGASLDISHIDCPGLQIKIDAEPKAYVRLQITGPTGSGNGVDVVDATLTIPEAKTLLDMLATAIKFASDKGGISK